MGRREGTRRQRVTVIVTVLVLLFGAVVSVQAESIFALTTGSSLISFDSATPNVLTSNAAISGLQSGESLVGIDFRPATGQLYGVGTSNNLYTLNSITGAATQAPTLNTVLNGTAFGVDFNPVPDRLRVTSNAEQNLHINVADGVAITDGSLAYASGDPRFGQNPNIVGSARPRCSASTPVLICW